MLYSNSPPSSGPTTYDFTAGSVAPDWRAISRPARSCSSLRPDLKVARLMWKIIVFSLRRFPWLAPCWLSRGLLDRRAEPALYRYFAGRDELADRAGGRCPRQWPGRSDRALPQRTGGDEGTRTLDPLLAKQ